MNLTFDEFCNENLSVIGGSVFTRNELFNKTSLKEQYEQLIKAFDCNLKRGAITCLFNSNYQCYLKFGHDGKHKRMNGDELD